jgi:hypothetical protein
MLLLTDSGVHIPHFAATMGLGMHGQAELADNCVVRRSFVPARVICTSRRHLNEAPARRLLKSADAQVDAWIGLPRRRSEAA